ncbi:hypothetical protein [Antarcticimicrobium sediminis]|uniref:Uncharacterized protein n=1 Tax=Antarcticimicrobium sediminis TaxID=2546227 RepID=A0A4R5EY49_9RHOB|nr:hypothetical protein [Antarcticimicrobium sediminis]TDE40008.1 hypothetical protein E1B25_03335 [Antarcticimicrobium sediminis]
MKKMQNRDEHGCKVQPATEATQQALRPPISLDREIDAMLVSDAYLFRGKDRNALEVLAFRVLGELLRMNPLGSNEASFMSQISRLVPGKTDIEYQAIYQRALDEWTEAYGY